MFESLITNLVTCPNVLLKNKFSTINFKLYLSKPSFHWFILAFTQRVSKRGGSRNVTPTIHLGLILATDSHAKINHLSNTYGVGYFALQCSKLCNILKYFFRIHRVPKRALPNPVTRKPVEIML